MPTAKSILNRTKRSIDFLFLSFLFSIDKSLFSQFASVCGLLSLFEFFWVCQSSLDILCSFLLFLCSVFRSVVHSVLFSPVVQLVYLSIYFFFFFFTLESPHHSLQHSYIGSVITSHSLFLQGFLKKTLLNRSLTFFFLIYFTFFNLA